MTAKLFSRALYLSLVIALAACGSSTGKSNSAQGDTGPGSDAMSSSNAVEGTPNLSDVVTLDAGVTMRVLWTISGYVLGPGSTVDEQAAQAMIFKPLDINDTTITFDGQTCQNVTFRDETINAADYLANVWKVTPQSLGIDVQELQVFKTNCSLPGFQEYMRLADGRLIVPIDGVFYIFEPAVNR